MPFGHAKLVHIVIRIRIAGILAVLALAVKVQTEMRNLLGLNFCGHEEVVDNFVQLILIRVEFAQLAHWICPVLLHLLTMQSDARVDAVLLQEFYKLTLVLG